MVLQGALHTKQMAEHYGVPVILHSDHCAKKLLPWFDGMLEADEKHFKEHGTPLFSSHMLDLSEEPHEENIATCAEYLKRMAKINCLLEMEIGITGGEEDGVNNEDAKPEDLYSKPEEVMQVVEAFSKVPNAMYTIAAAFGNVHGVYKAGNVKLSPEILGAAQAHVKEKTGSKEDKPVFFVFHGGSGSEKVSRQIMEATCCVAPGLFLCGCVGAWVCARVLRECVRVCCVTHVCIQDKIKEALNHGVVKMNIDTDIQVQLANITQMIDSQPASQTCLADEEIDVHSVACTLAGISAVHALCCECNVSRNLSELFSHRWGHAARDGCWLCCASMRARKRGCVGKGSVNKGTPERLCHCEPSLL